jgi:hypothetical protein
LPRSPSGGWDTRPGLSICSPTMTTIICWRSSRFGEHGGGGPINYVVRSRPGLPLAASW